MREAAANMVFTVTVIAIVVFLSLGGFKNKAVPSPEEGKPEATLDMPWNAEGNGDK